MRFPRAVRMCVLAALSIALLSIALLSIPVLSTPARADWLVTRDGAQLETQGPWRVEGRQVLFHRLGGALASLRTDDLDLEASRTLTAEKDAEKKAAEAKPEAAPAEPARRPASAARVTNPEVKGGGARAQATPSAATAESPAAAAAAVPAIEVDPPFSIHAVAFTETQDGWTVTGTLRLTGGADVVKVVVAHLLVFDGEAELDSTPVELSGQRLPPGAGTTFRGNLVRDPRGHRLRLEVDVEEPEG